MKPEGRSKLEVSPSRRGTLRNFNVAMCVPTLVVLLGPALLIALPARAADKQASPIAAEYERIHKEFEQEQKAFSEASRKAKTDEERNNLKFPDREKYAAQMLALAEKRPTDPVAVDIVGWIIGFSRQNSPLPTKALELITKHHIESNNITELCEMLTDDETKVDFLREVLRKNPHQTVKGAAALSLAQTMAASNPARAESYFNDVVEKYGTKEQKEAAKGALFEMKNLAIGKVAPEIEGEDVDGKRFKLSDYRGKVVLIDFWGDW